VIVLEVDGIDAAFDVPVISVACQYQARIGGLRLHTSIMRISLSVFIWKMLNEI
jgi:hypothetical protein